MDPKDPGKGNTSLPSPCRAPLRISHFFTWNNYGANWKFLLDAAFSKNCIKWAFQEETEESGTPHIQGVVLCKKKIRATAFKLPNTIHWEPTKNFEDAVIYCTKDDSRTGVRVMEGFPKAVAVISKLRPWQTEIVELIKTEPDDRTVHWYWSKEGNIGKSALTKLLVIKYKAIFCASGKYSDLCNLIFNNDMDASNIVIFDIPRNNGNKISYSALESIKNGLISNTKYETGFKAFNSPHVIVFSNHMPDENELSADRWHIVELK